MPIVLAILIVAGAVPIGRAIWANRRTSLLHALVWTMIAWLTWGVVFLDDDAGSTVMQPSRYCALCLTGCAGIAVLGARRPHVFAWNFVVLGLLAVMVLPLAERWIIGAHSLDGLRIAFMTGTIALGILNYTPTRLAPVALLLAFICAGEMIRLYAPEQFDRLKVRVFDWQLVLLPWLTWLVLRKHASERSDFDRLWLDFRDRWGLLWSQRMREQFNHAAEHAGWPVKLTWRGLRQEKDTPALGPADQEKIVETLRSVLQRFLAADQQS